MKTTFKSFELRTVNGDSKKYELIKRFNDRETSYCLVVAFIEWNKHEPCWEFKSVGMRYFEHYEDGLSNFINEFFISAFEDNRPCLYYKDEFCIKDDCPYCAEWCECVQHPRVCKFYEPKGGR